jgi:hypothetical protein
MAANLEDKFSAQLVNTNSQFGGRTMKRRRHIKHNITGTKGRGTYMRNWSKMSPGTHERTLMLERCGKKCFLGPNKSFPICRRNTCKINRKGVYAAYVRAKQYMSIKGDTKYNRISSRAHHMLYKK